MGQEPKTEKLTIRVTKTVFGKVNKLAEDQRRDLVDMVRIMIDDYIAAREPKPEAGSVAEAFWGDDKKGKP